MSTGAHLAPAPASPDARIEREMVRVAFGTWIQYVDGRVFSIFLALLMCRSISSIGNTAPAAAALWLALDIAWSLAASFAARRFFLHQETRPTQFWRLTLGAIWVSHALIWGGAVILFWDPANPTNQAVLCIFALGLMVSYFFQLASCLAVLLPTLITLSTLAWLQFLLGGGELSSAFLVAFPAFLVVLTNYSYQTAQKYHTALRLRFENETLAQELLKANHAKSTFLASMSHELRTPLNAILGYSDLIRQRVFGPIAPARYGAYVEDIHTSGSHLLRMIDDLLDLAKIEAGKRDLSFTAVKLDSVAQEAIKLVSPQAGRAMIDIMLDFKHDAIVKADTRAVKQMMTNLLSNAVKFSRAGGIGVVFCEVLDDGSTAFGVKDTGVGMTPEMQEKAVEPFAQDSDAYTIEGRGTGLGLPIVKGLIEAHQGRLKIESSPGAGSKIWVEFPPERLLRKMAAA